MNSLLKFALLLASASLIGGCTGNDSESVTEVGMDANEAVNEPAVVADQQSNSEQDVEVTRQIRQNIMKDESLSTNAKNVKIITANGAVTLTGVVDSQAEKTKVESHARAAAGATPVQNQIEITQ